MSKTFKKMRPRVIKYKNHSQCHCDERKTKNAKFTFHEADNEKIIKEIKRLNENKASQNSDIPITIIHKNADIFADFLAESLKGAIKEKY